MCHLHHKTISLAFSYLVNSRPQLRLTHSLTFSLALSLQIPEQVCCLYQFSSGQLVISLHCPTQKHQPPQTLQCAGRGGLGSPARIWILAACKLKGTGL